MIKPLIAIVTCHKFKSRADAQRKTWVPYIRQLGDQAPDYKFFLGTTDEREPESDEVFLDVPDDYNSLPYKTRAVMRWAQENGYNAVFKCDDDTYVFPERLVNMYPTHPYEGRLNNSQYMIAPHGWCSGFAYWLAGEALGIIAAADIDPTFKAEDLWVGSTLSKHKIKCHKIDSYMVLHLYPQTEWHKFRNQAIAVCEFPDGLMYTIHEIMRSTGPGPVVMRNPSETSAPLLAATPEQTNDVNPRVARIFPLGRFGKVVKRPGWPH